MSDAFRILARFLDQFDLEVEGRSQEDPPEDVQSTLRQFARGELDDTRRTQLIALLGDHPQWVSFLVREVKSQRPSPTSQ